MKHLGLSGLSNFDSIFKDMDKFFDNVFCDISKSEVVRAIEGFPVTSVFTNENGDYKIDIAVTGFTREDINLTVEDGLLTVEGNVKEEEDNKEWVFVAGKLKHTKFQKKYRLSNKLDTNDVDVTMKDGILTVIFRRKEETRPKQLTIK